MKTRKILFNYFVIVGLAAAATPLYSTTVEYSSKSSWTAAVSGVTTTTFDTAVTGYIPPGPDGNVNLANGGITLDGVTFTGYDNGVGHPGNTPAQYGLSIINGGATLGQYYNWGTGGAILTGQSYQGALAHLHMSFATAVTAWGSDLMIGGGPGNYSVQINGGACSTACLATTFAFPQSAFFGMTSDIPINFIDLFVPSNGRPELDNFSTATAILGGGGGGGDIPSGDTPEMATILLCATGLISLAKFKKIRSLSFS